MVIIIGMMPIREFKYIYVYRAHVFIPCKGVTLRDDNIVLPHIRLYYIIIITIISSSDDR